MCGLIKGAGAIFVRARICRLAENCRVDVMENLADAENLMELFSMIRKIKIPVIAAGSRSALAGGCGLATACDMFWLQSRRVSLPEVRIGLFRRCDGNFARNLSEKNL